mgnify:FL=1
MGELIDKLMNYEKEGIYPFHMPGHKRNIDVCFNPYKYDITEITGFDDLHKAEDVLLRLTERISKMYSADKSYILNNGSTSGIMTAISAIAGYNDTVLVARNCHKSVYNTLILRGINPEYIYPQVDKNTGINLAINASDVEKALEPNNKIKAVIITSPTYEGIVSDIEEISKVVHRRNIPLIVDCAHFGFSDFFPQNPVRLGADMVIMSLHKTLPAFTQTAVMCVKSGFVDIDEIDRYYHIYLSSSPSYILMASVEYCMDYLNDDIFLKYKNKLISFYEKCKLEKLHFYPTEDMGKIVISTWDCDINGIQLKEILRDKYQLEMEMASLEYVIAMTSVCDTVDGFNRLADALMEIDSLCNKKQKQEFTVPERAGTGITLYEAVSSVKRKIKYNDAEGKISGDFIFVYPPGIPVITPGEIFNKKIIECIDRYVESGANMYGIDLHKMVSICTEEG